MPPTSTMPSVFQVGTRSVGAPSPGRQAAILTNLPGWPDLHDKDSADMLQSDVRMEPYVNAVFSAAWTVPTSVSLSAGLQDKTVMGFEIILLLWHGTTRADGSHLKKL